jgi:2-polyprenyl-3-methyl-5-hydroxy-6-metoxy-1,4-benzoquinol methylase
MNSGKTAIKRNTPSVPLRLLMDEMPLLCKVAGKPPLIDQKVKFFDLGCGRGDDIEWLKRYLKPTGATVAGYDPNHGSWPEPSSIASGTYDIVTCIYVLNVLQEPQMRMDVLKDARHLVKEGGLVAVATRAHGAVRRAVRDGWKKTGDGWITTTGTFQRGFSPGELAKLMVDAGFEIVVSLASNSSYSMVVGIDNLLLDNWEV